ncbi:CoA pyrophosphatase [soil metagenome]
MQVEHFIAKLSDRLRKELPGALAHEPLRAISLGDIRPSFTHKDPPRPGAVVILLYEEDGKLYFPLTQRAEYAGAHSGQISLPGGKSEDGETIDQTGLRETWEEIGIEPGKVEVLGKLSDFFVIPSNFMVTPIVGYHRGVPSFVPDPFEVAKILRGSVEDMSHEDAIQVKEIMAASIFRMQAPHFLIEGQVVWGATAMILNEFRTVLKELELD